TMTRRNTMSVARCQCLVLAVFALCAASVIGCGAPSKPSGKVEGQVTYKGQPINEGDVNFHSRTTGVAALAQLNAGKFSFPQSIEVGEYAVYVSPPRPEPTDPRQGPPPVIKSDIPLKARDMTTSGLTATVKEGANTFVFEIND